MSVTRNDLEERVIEIIGQALDRRSEQIGRHDSLIDDLGAESIDFLDIRFRVERAFKIKIPEDEIWEGSLRFEAPDLVDKTGVSDEGLAWLKGKMPGFAWGRFPKGVSKADLPRLITPETIVDYLARRLEAANT